MKGLAPLKLPQIIAWSLGTTLSYWAISNAPPEPPSPLTERALWPLALKGSLNCSRSYIARYNLGVLAGNSVSDTPPASKAPASPSTEKSVGWLIQAKTAMAL
jgi:hypothetical protein